ncbi:MAG: serine--tRNA ligase [Bacteroidetes bacterium]|nr:serine--tRNA ligase [Bacteroidota bacterium]MBK9672682.1 serine--tRNA ligase [Bacteroidota bacterium]MBK9800298.1 serine--tRNA ligase [Bacteroidota bacterium]MBP6412456.1 serine--tRNA ligase [Bacteroidia bacterium]
MLQLNYIRENKEEVINRLSVKNFDAKESIEKVLELDNDRRRTQNELDALLNEANTLAKQVGELYKSGKKAEGDDLKNKSGALKESSKKLEEALSEIEAEQHKLLLIIPNTPSPKVPKGKSPEENENVFQEGTIPTLYADAKPHWELAAKYDLIDFELGVKLTGAGFPVYKGKGARLQRALINFFLDNATAAGYLEVQPPIMVNEASGYGTGQLPDKEGQMYHVGVDNLYLIPTAEVPITNIYRDVILKAEQFPIKNCGYTPCFRREAGSYGKDVRGLNRLHQFDKVEIVQIAHPDKSYQTLEEMREYVAGLMRQLELPFRILKLCGGDMSFASALTYDFEAYSAAQQKWLEVSSVSNFETFQSNRLKLRFKEGDAKPQLAHTLNGSALALPRIVASLLENNQTEKGIRIPKALVPYTGFEWIN